jgi:CDP-diglyceride synthetase
MTRLDKSGFAGIVVSVLVLCLGVTTLLKGKLQYSNYWSGAVFAPFAVLIGVLGILAGIIIWRKSRRRT